MESCATCGRPRKAGLKFCTDCGTRFAEQTEQAAPTRADPPPPEPPPEPGRPRRRPRQYAGWLRAGFAVVLAGIAAGVFLVVSHENGKPPGNSLSGNTRAIGTSRAAPTATATSPSPSPDSQPSASATPGGVAVLPSVAGDQDTASVASFLGQYFAAINSRDYQAYISMFSLQGRPALTQQQFTTGYESTTDSAETLTGLSTAANGDLAANVSFTSHQDPADSVTGTQSCTDWTLTFYLLQANGGYLIDKPPAGYHAAYTAC
jgi:hypothetical protein